MSLPPGSTIGIIGGGQLGRMSAMAAARLGYRVHIFTPEANSPASQVAAATTMADYTDHAALTAFAAAVDVVTFEFENIPAASLQILTNLKPVHPSAEILAISQDRLVEKDFLNKAGAPTAPYAAVETDADLAAAIEKLGLPAVLKTTRLGYDGKGQAMLRTTEDTAAAFAALSPKPLVLEGFVNFACEISVIIARSADGSIASFDPVENRHKHHILDLTLAPAPLPLGLLAEATKLGRLIAQALNLVGLLAVEMFVTADGALLINEIAPRPHNSGHWTMDACPASQFEMHIRAVAGLPLPPATRHADAVMKNLVGPDDMADWPLILATPGLIAHHYGKAEARLGRKMGHVNRLFPKGSLPGEFGIEAALKYK
ncbi:MAG: 5-(carboxyamino)imidazole ribonucleotide synthase [Acidocella sp. 20-57-95]|nr:MAG: 5-(carboxyamino)imidazole ribonucleotide synthase [Acidocella sp. 20-57-95]OYV62266.1 MAG: 5-(carboxyamino)imidazole ribonucleotide synthase [Acidocella sp. 21-58-7]HQT63079.1 5-(carboxyamino)imidazole ribonucleotide synthase [Acidocella sp.]HQU03608.1 5-(carboxyamino)imidazole ribonucleotide synthase [Acidocella sp.]